MADVKAVKRYLAEKTEELTSKLPPDEAIDVHLHMIQHSQSLVAGIESRREAALNKPASDQVDLGGDFHS